MAKIIYSVDPDKAKELKNIKLQPNLTTLNGVGKKIYGDTAYIVLLFIPIWPCARYELIRHNDKTVTLIGQKKLENWQIAFRIAVVVIIVYAIFGLAITSALQN